MEIVAGFLTIFKYQGPFYISRYKSIYLHFPTVKIDLYGAARYAGAGAAYNLI